jgi:hypothetical protein
MEVATKITHHIQLILLWVKLKKDGPLFETSCSSNIITILLMPWKEHVLNHIVSDCKLPTNLIVLLQIVARTKPQQFNFQLR